MDDPILQNYRAAFFDYVEAEQPTELPQLGKENLSGMVYESNTVQSEATVENTQPEEKHERTL